jgi:hypothetical protein
MKRLRQWLGILGITLCVAPIAWTVQSRMNFNGEQDSPTAIQRSLTDNEIVELVASILPPTLGEPNQELLPAPGAGPIFHGFPQRSLRETPAGPGPSIRNPPQMGLHSDVSCFLQDCQGNVVSRIRMSHMGDQYCWMNYVSGGSRADTVTFVVAPAFTNAPLSRLVQQFHPRSASNIAAPLGIPHWYPGQTQGPWVLVVYNNLGDYAVEFFDVVP